MVGQTFPENTKKTGITGTPHLLLAMTRQSALSWHYAAKCRNVRSLGANHSFKKSFLMLTPVKTTGRAASHNTSRNEVATNATS
eukprot:2268467-Amphidinium_carterae.1